MSGRGTGLTVGSKGQSSAGRWQRTRECRNIETTHVRTHACMHAHTNTHTHTRKHAYRHIGPQTHTAPPPQSNQPSALPLYLLHSLFHPSSHTRTHGHINLLFSSFTSFNSLIYLSGTPFNPLWLTPHLFWCLYSCSPLSGPCDGPHRFSLPEGLEPRCIARAHRTPPDLECAKFQGERRASGSLVCDERYII